MMRYPERPRPCHPADEICPDGIDDIGENYRYAAGDPLEGRHT